MIFRSIAAGFLTATCLHAQPVRSGHAAAEWISTSSTVMPGTSVRTAIRLTIDPGWHTYWVNPGEAGMATSVVWDLPPGWTISSFSHPSPKRFLTGELVGFGHQGTVLFPVEISSPAEFSGAQVLRATVKWLSCNDEACVPGEARILLKLNAGNPHPSPHATIVAGSFDALPQPAGPGIRLTLSEQTDQLTLHITGPSPVDPAAATTYILTPDIVDPKAPIQWKKTEEGWQARVAKSPYIPTDLPQLELQLTPPAPQRPLLLSWKKPPKP